MKSRTLILYVTFFLLSFSVIQTKAVTSDTVKIVILSLNDQHAKIDNYGHLKAALDEIRSKNNDVLLFAAGDNFTGNPIVDQYVDKGFPIIDLMNTVGFNATAIGNHEFDYGQETLGRRIEQASFPFLNSNIKDESGNPKYKPYHIFKLNNGIRVAVISAIQLGTDGTPDSHPSNLKGLFFNDGISELLKYKNLRDSCDIFIALTHIGFEEDIKLAEQMPQLDLILGGHTHTLTKPSHLVNGINILQAGSNVRNLSKTTIYIVNGKAVKITPEMLDLTKYKPGDPEIENKLRLFNDNKELNKVIGKTSGMHGSDELGSMMTDAVTSLKEVDVAFQNNGGIRIDMLEQGDISVKDVYKLDPFGNEVILISMSPKEIKSLILNAYIQAGNSIDLQVSGLTYTVITDQNNKAGNVELKWPDGKKVKKCKKINVGLNSYIASSYKFDHKDPGKSLYITTAETLINYIKSQKDINYKGVKRAFIK